MGGFTHSRNGVQSGSGSRPARCIPCWRRPRIPCRGVSPCRPATRALLDQILKRPPGDSQVPHRPRHCGRSDHPKKRHDTFRLGWQPVVLTRPGGRMEGDSFRTHDPEGKRDWCGCRPTHTWQTYSNHRPGLRPGVRVTEWVHLCVSHPVSHPVSHSVRRLQLFHKEGPHSRVRCEAHWEMNRSAVRAR
jgi:hypothetical protein